jgi:putative ABC transport system permease protein
MITELLTRLRFLFTCRKPADLDDELAFHVEQSTSQRIANGASPDEARRLALIEFGGVERAREHCHEQRPGWWMGTVAQDARYALRGFRRNPVFTVTVLSTLTLGIGATTAVFSVVDRILFRPLPYAHGDRLVSVGLTAPIIPEEFLLGGSYYVWRDNQKPFEAFTSETGANQCDLTERNPARLSCTGVEVSFLPTLGISPILGRNFTIDEDRPNAPKVALISYGLWQSHYARDPAIVNRLIDIDGVQTRVIGVLPRDFEMPALEAADILVPEALDEAAQRRADPGRVMYGFARLKRGVTVQQAHAMLEPLFQYSLSLAPAPFRKEVHLRVRSLRDRQVRDLRTAAWILLGAVIAVLLIACANVASLLMARAAARERELAVRSVLGASRRRLIRQALTETLLLSLAGAASGCALAEILLRTFIAIAPDGVPFLGNAHLDLRVVLFTVLLSLLCGALFGILPAVEKPRASALAARGSGFIRHAWLRRCLVAGQIAVCMVLLAGAALLVRSFRNIEEQTIGLETRGVVSASIELPSYRYNTPQKQMDLSLRVETVLRRLPGIESVAISDSLPPGGNHHDQIYNLMKIAGHPATTSGTGGMMAWRWVTPSYFSALGIPIVRGPGFTEAERTESENYIVLSSLLATRLFGAENPVGQRVQPSPDRPWCLVAGVAGEVKNSGLTEADEPEFYRLRRNVSDDWIPSAVLILRSSLPPAAVENWAKTQIAQIDPALPVDIQTLNQTVSKLAGRPRFETALLAFFALCGLAMALIGLYGVISFIATQRTQEIGVRMALGATRGDILRLIAGEGLRLILIGGVLGLAAALAAAQLLKSLLFNVGAHDPASFAAVALLLGAVAIAATLIPARAAMRVEPVVALRYE